MKQHVEQIGTVISNSSGIVQDNRQAVMFEGESLATRREFGTGRDGRPTDTRGRIETLYRTVDGRLLVHVNAWSHWQGEPTTETLQEVTEADLAPTGNFAALGAEAGWGRPLTLAEALPDAPRPRPSVAAELAICLGYLKLDRSGDLAGSEVACLACDQACEAGIWLAVMQSPDGEQCLIGPYCDLCASSA